MDLYFSDVCWFRLDFECFTTVGVNSNEETNGGQCSTDTFNVAVFDICIMYVKFKSCPNFIVLRQVRDSQCQRYAAKTRDNTVSLKSKKL